VSEEVFQLPSPGLLARMMIARISSAEAQMAWRALHYRPRSTQTPGGLAYWPCVFCKVEKD
jgi:hypothetical protein